MSCPAVPGWMTSVNLSAGHDTENPVGLNRSSTPRCRAAMDFLSSTPTLLAPLYPCPTPAASTFSFPGTAHPGRIQPGRLPEPPGFACWRAARTAAFLLTTYPALWGVPASCYDVSSTAGAGPDCSAVPSPSGGSSTTSHSDPPGCQPSPTSSLSLCAGFSGSSSQVSARPRSGGCAGRMRWRPST